MAAEIERLRLRDCDCVFDRRPVQRPVRPMGGLTHREYRSEMLIGRRTPGPRRRRAARDAEACVRAERPDSQSAAKSVKSYETALLRSIETLGVRVLAGR